MRLLSRVARFQYGLSAVIAAFLSSSFFQGIAIAGTVTLKGSGGGAWGGTANTCTYSGVVADSAGNIVVTCQDSGGGSGPKPPIIGDAPNASLAQNVAMTPISLSAYVTATDGDPITGYNYTGSLPPELKFDTKTGVISGTPTTAGVFTITWTASDKDGAGTGDTLQFTVSLPTTGCPPLPNNFLVLHPEGSAYGGTWHPDNNSATYLASLPAGNGIALEFKVNKSVYPYGFAASDYTGGTKTYAISRCPGSMVPVDDQDGSISVNGDAKLDNCKINKTTIRWKDTSGTSPSYYTGSRLSFQTSCFLPTTTELGSSAPATYYINILNTGASAQGIQFGNVAQGS